MTQSTDVTSSYKGNKGKMPGTKEMSVGKILAEFAKIRQEGIILFNKEEAGKEHPEFQGE